MTRLRTVELWTRVVPLLAILLAGVCLSVGVAVEPYPFKRKPPEVQKELWLDIDFESSLPEGTELGSKAKVEEKSGMRGTKGLVSSGKGMIARFPINKKKVDISRFELLVDYAGPGFSLFTAKMNAYDIQGKLLRSVNIGQEWGISPALRTWEKRKADLEFEEIHTVALEIEQTNDEGEVKLDNIKLYHHELSSMLGKTARKDLSLSLKQEGLKVDDVADIWVGTGTDRQSFFDFSKIEENKRYVRSDWQERLHIGTTFKTSRGKLPTFVLGVSAREAALQAAAKRTGKTLADMHVLLLDDVKSHGFNAVWCDFTTDLEKFDALAATRGISLILRDPNWSGLETWVAKPDGPMPEAFKTAATAKLKQLAKLKSLLGYQLSRPLNTAHQKMLAEARKYLATVAPDVQLISHDSDVYASENMQEPYPNIGIQFSTFQHYAGKPWVGPSYLYHPNYWPIGISEGWYRRIHNAYHVRTIPTLWSIPAGRSYSKNTLGMQADQVRVEVSGWTQDEKTKRWSGWLHYDMPESMLQSTLWTAVEAGASGVLVEEWGPAEIPATTTGPEILTSSKYAEGVYKVDTLRKFDLSESDEWKELGKTAEDFAGLRLFLADCTTHGHNSARTNNGDVRVRTLTGRDDPYKVLAIVNTRIGKYDQDKLKVDPKDGKLDGFEPATSLTYQLTIEKDYGLIDMMTGKTVEPRSVITKDKSAVYDLEIGAGEGRFYFRGKSNLYQRFAAKFKIPSGGLNGLRASR